VRARLTRYSVRGWGDGELWTLGGVVLAHDFRFLADEQLNGVSNVLRARPHEGAQGSPSSTVATISSRMGNDFVSSHNRGSASSEGVTPEEIVRRMTDHLAGVEVPLDDVELDLAWATPFQRALAGELRSVRRGEVVTYGELAALAGRPRAARAAGSFCARNRFALLIPCHRVVASDGIGGYGATGVGVKRRLLALEGVSL